MVKDRRTAAAKKRAKTAPPIGSAKADNPLKGGSPMPRYYQVSKMLWSRIVSGFYPPGSLIGTESELAASFGVSRITIRQALDILATQGLVVRQRARGTFVAENVVQQSTVELNGFLDDVILQADTAGTVFADKVRIKAPSEVAKKLEVKTGTPIVRFRRLRSNALGPKVWLLDYVPADIGRKYSVEQVQREALLRLIDSDPDTHLASGHQTIGAQVADDEIARHLNVQVGAPVVYVERVVYSDTDRPLQFACLYYPADRFAFSVRLSRLKR